MPPLALVNEVVPWHETHTPVAPLWSHFQHTIFPRVYEDWIAYDQAMLHLYDACLRLTAEHPATGYRQHDSTGADNEVKTFQSLGKPVFYSLEELYQWADSLGA